MNILYHELNYIVLLCNNIVIHVLFYQIDNRLFEANLVLQGVTIGLDEIPDLLLIHKDSTDELKETQKRLILENSNFDLFILSKSILLSDLRSKSNQNLV